MCWLPDCIDPSHRRRSLCLHQLLARRYHRFHPPHHPLSTAHTDTRYWSILPLDFFFFFLHKWKWWGESIFLQILVHKTLMVKSILCKYKQFYTPLLGRVSKIINMLLGFNNTYHFTDQYGVHTVTNFLTKELCADGYIYNLSEQSAIN